MNHILEIRDRVSKKRQSWDHTLAETNQQMADLGANAGKMAFNNLSSSVESATSSIGLAREGVAFWSQIDELARSAASSAEFLQCLLFASVFSNLSRDRRSGYMWKDALCIALGATSEEVAREAFLKIDFGMENK